MTHFLNQPTRAFRHYFIALFFFMVWLSAWAQPCQDATTIKPTTTAKAFNATTTMQSCYPSGASAKVSFAISPNAADLNAPRAVVVFDIVSADDGAYPSRIMQVIDVNSLSVTPDIFRDSIEMSLVEAGLEGEITFKMRDNAPAGNYTMVISIFRLPEGLRPRDVTYDRNALAGRVFYAFRIEN